MKILIIEDDQNTLDMLTTSLISEHHVVETATDGSEGSFLARSYEYDAIILDYSLPKKDGLTICREIRNIGKSTPIIFLSMTDDIDTKVAAFNYGADDYVVKPYSLQEIHARLRAVHRRPKIAERSIIRVGDLVLDADKHLVTRNERDIHLTRKEFSMLEYLIHHQNTVVSRALLMEYVWTADSDPFSNTVEAHMRNLRKKINIDGALDLISTIPGRGYMISAKNSRSTSLAE